MGNKRDDVTAGELLAQLAADPKYQVMRGARDRKLADLAEQRRCEQQPLLNDLAAAGVMVDWVGRLMECSNPNTRIYPVLLDHIAKPYSSWLLEWIGRAFGRKAARPIVWDSLIALVKSPSLQERAVEGVMASIAEMARSDDLHTLIDLLSDRSLGPNRIYLVNKLMRSKRPEARTALLRLEADPDLTKQITACLSLAKANVG